jgi:hypothetical protein
MHFQSIYNLNLNERQSYISIQPYFRPFMPKLNPIVPIPSLPPFVLQPSHLYLGHCSGVSAQV